MSENNEMAKASRQAAESSEVDRMRQAVESFSLRFDPAAGEELRSMLEDHLADVDNWLQRAGNLARRAPLGNNPVGTAMAEKFANRADGAENSFAEVLKRYREVLQEARDAVSDSLRTYQEIDANAADRLRGLMQ